MRLNNHVSKKGVEEFEPLSPQSLPICSVAPLGDVDETIKIICKNRTLSVFDSGNGVTGRF